MLFGSRECGVKFKGSNRMRNTRVGLRIAYRNIFLIRGATNFLHTTMDPYDSDSSVDEDFTETSVLLGYAAEEVIEDTISHLGGWPVCSLQIQHPAED